MNQNIKNKLLPLTLSFAVILLDQITKCLVVKFIPRLTFSMGSGLSDGLRGILFALLPLFVIIAVYVIYFRNNEFTKLQRWAVCGILGGGIGNLIDRFFRPEGVVDFVDCYFFGLFGMERWPTFNFADAAVVVCGIIFVITFVFQVKSDRKNNKKE